MPRHESLPALLRRVRACTICAAHLPLGPRPVLQAGRSARILIAGQAPGRKVHASGIPFDDASGQRLRDWLGLTPEQFYDPARVAILPMGFCYPGKGASGDAPPRPECAPAWRAQLLAQLPQLAFTVVLGQYALAWHMPDERGG
ncbi:MAG: uracil-DNA glycosylase family protein, partial [Proteobacteria bacterium]|nr:uracil-DNA glycosylase family protein [Pseudomonadota bacterium]